ncbi:hypothetical protein [Streptomyces sp. SS8]
MNGTRCTRCELLIGMGCACPSPGKGRRKRPVAVRRIPKSKARQGVKRPDSARPLRGDAFSYGDYGDYGDDRAAEEFREELRDITERGSSVRTVSGGLPTLGRRR